MNYISRINYITSYKKNDNKETNVARLNLQDLSYQWTPDNLHFHFVYQDQIIKRDNNYQVNFNCITCNRENIVGINNFVKKIEKQTTKCFNCSNDYNDKSLVSKIELDEEYFHNVLDYKNKQIFCKKMMRPDQFEKIRHQIKAVNNNKYTDINNMVYIPYYRPTESKTHYESCLYDKSLDIVLRATNITLECRHCKHNFITDNIKSYRNKKTIYCTMCDVNYGPTKNKYECNILGNNVAYKTKMQHKFIKYCNNNEIVCENGPSGIKLPSISDQVSIQFIIAPFCIDVVGNKEYQTKESVKTIELKEYCNSNNYEYVIIHPKNYVKYTRKFKTHIPITPLLNHH